MSKKVKVGDVFEANGGGFVEVVSLIGSRHVEVRSLNEGGGVYKANKTSIKNSTARNPYKSTVYGVGYLGVGKHEAVENGKITKAYSIWSGVLARCYSEEAKEVFTSYIGCIISEEWKNFQNFAEWYKNQVGCQDDYHIDKDILVKGNKVYSAETCCLVPPEINILFKEYKNKKSGLPVGVFKHRNGRFKSVVKIDGKELFIGAYDTVEEARKAYLSVKSVYVKLKVMKYKGKISDVAYDRIYNYVWE